MRKKGSELQSELHYLSRENKTVLRQTMLKEIAKNSGVSEQINELVGILVEAEINSPSSSATV